MFHVACYEIVFFLEQKNNNLLPIEGKALILSHFLKETRYFHLFVCLQNQYTYVTLLT